MKFLLPLVISVLVGAGPGHAETEARARNLINSLGCKGCHRLEGRGGTLGPPLDGVGNRLAPAQIRAKLVDPQATGTDSPMPAYRHLGQADLEALVGFLTALK